MSDNPMDEFVRKTLRKGSNELQMKLDAIREANDMSMRENALAAAVNAICPLENDASLDQVSEFAVNVMHLANAFLSWLKAEDEISRLAAVVPPEVNDNLEEYEKDFSLADLVAEGKQELVDEDFQKDFTRLTGEEFHRPCRFTPYACRICDQEVAFNEHDGWVHVNGLTAVCSFPEPDGLEK